MFGRKARKNRAIQSWRRAAQLIIPVAQTIGAVCIIYITHLLLHYEVEQDFIIGYNRQRLCH